LDVAFGKGPANKKLEMVKLEDGSKKMATISEMLTYILFFTTLRDTQILMALFPELLPYMITPADRRHITNVNNLKNIMR
jgi:hypothetical protein